MLVRRFLGQRLAEYYAQPSEKVVGSIVAAASSSSDNGISFSSLWGEWHWRRVYRRLYEQQEGQWLTPVELFRPFYSNVLANFIRQQASEEEQEEEIHVVELGGGRGTNAYLILSHLQRTHPALYGRISSYTIVDSSPSLLELQEEVLLDSDHADKFRFQETDLLDVAEDRVPLLEYSDCPTVVIAVELLDNLPHDKVRKDQRTRLLEQAELRFGEASDDLLNEEFVPLSDSLLTKILKRVPAYGGTAGRPTWVPTVACGVLDQLGQVRPNSSLIVADFDYLPPPDLLLSDDSSEASSGVTTKRTSVLADGEPLVTDMEGIDYDCYLNAPNAYCDILFPTDFDRLAAFVRKSWKCTDNRSNVSVSNMKQSDFLQRYGPSEVRATQSWLTGYTPLLHDFANCSVLTVSRGGSSSDTVDETQS